MDADMMDLWNEKRSMVRDARRRKRRWPRWLAAACFVVTANAPHAEGTTWIEQADAALTCTALSDAGEAAQLPAPSLTSPTDARSVRSYLAGKPADERH